MEYFTFNGRTLKPVRVEWEKSNYVQKIIVPFKRKKKLYFDLDIFSESTFRFNPSGRKGFLLVSISGIIPYIFCRRKCLTNHRFQLNNDIIDQIRNWLKLALIFISVNGVKSLGASVTLSWQIDKLCSIYKFEFEKLENQRVEA